MLLGWVTERWRHSGGSHDASNDANVVLDRVEQGERFACGEYTVVLTQALNAVQIPARPISLFRLDYYAGRGTGHVVTEAWIDDLGKWVVLDGQNGAVWRDAAGCRSASWSCSSGTSSATSRIFRAMGKISTPTRRPGGSGTSTLPAWPGAPAWSPGPYVPVMEGAAAIASQRLTESLAGAAPDLAEISTGVADHQGPALVFHADHPYATGFQVTDASGQATGLYRPAVPPGRGRGAARADGCRQDPLRHPDAPAAGVRRQLTRFG